MRRKEDCAQSTDTKQPSEVTQHHIVYVLHEHYLEIYEIKISFSLEQTHNP